MVLGFTATIRVLVIARSFPLCASVSFCLAPCMQMLPSCMLADLLPCGCAELLLPSRHCRNTSALPALPMAELSASLPGGGLAPAAEALEGSQVTSDSEGDVYCDTLEQMEPEQVTEGWEALESCRTTAEAFPAASPALPALYRQISPYCQLPQLRTPPQHCHPGSPVRLPEPMGPPGCTPSVFCVPLGAWSPSPRGG